MQWVGDTESRRRLLRRCMLSRLPRTIRASFSCSPIALFSQSAIKDTMSKTVKRKRDADLQNEAKKPTVSVGHWANGLLVAMEDPNLQIYTDNRVVVIRDKYPKALHHFLVLPKEKISNLKEVNSSHLELLEYMHKVGEDIIKREEYERNTFRYVLLIITCCS